jgi:hypothetical protein
MSDEGKTTNGGLVDGVDFYREGPYVVFTEKYLRDRGYCCESGCRHCPFDFHPERSEGSAEAPGDGDEEIG